MTKRKVKIATSFLDCPSTILSSIFRWLDIKSNILLSICSKRLLKIFNLKSSSVYSLELDGNSIPFNPLPKSVLNQRPLLVYVKRRLHLYNNIHLNDIIEHATHLTLSSTPDQSSIRAGRKLINLTIESQNPPSLSIILLPRIPNNQLVNINIDVLLAPSLWYQILESQGTSLQTIRILGIDHKMKPDKSAWSAIHKQTLPCLEELSIETEPMTVSRLDIIAPFLPRLRSLSFEILLMSDKKTRHQQNTFLSLTALQCDIESNDVFLFMDAIPKPCVKKKRTNDLNTATVAAVPITALDNAADMATLRNSFQP